MNEHTETRLLVVAELLDRAVAELARVMEQVRAGTPLPGEVEKKAEGRDGG